MKKIKINLFTIFIISIILITSLSGCLDQQNKYYSKTTIIVGYNSEADFNKIQDAVNAAKPGSTIIIQNGTYNETITIKKTMKLIGNKNTKIFYINESTNNKNLIQLNASNCIIQNLTLINQNNSNNINGILITTNNNKISNLTISGFYDGIHIINDNKIDINISNNIYNNIITKNKNGIQAFKNSTNNIYNNSIIQNYEYGLYLNYGSNYNKIHHNNIKKNNQGLRLGSIENKIYNNNISDNFEYGIRIKGGRKNIIYNNSINNNSEGIYFCCSAEENQIYNNNFIKNYKWNTREYIPSSENLNIFYHNLPIGGNYWDDYNGVDNYNGPNQNTPGSDGIGDTPYIINDYKNKDKYPYIKPIEVTKN